MNIPPLQRKLVDDKNQVDHVWYGFFRGIFTAIFGEVTNSATGLATKLPVYASGGVTAWDDLRAPATAINPTGIVSPPSYDATHVGYSFSPTGDNRIDLIFQLPHGWKKGTNIHPHIHMRGLSNSNGNIIIQLYTSWSNSSGVQPDFTIVNTNIIMSNGSGNIVLKEHIVGLGNSVPNVLSNESSCVKYKMLRLGSAAGDTYTGDMLLDEFDCHYQVEKAGSPQEWPT